MNMSNMTKSTFYRGVNEYEEEKGIRNEHVDAEMLQVAKNIQMGRITSKEENPYHL